MQAVWLVRSRQMQASFRFWLAIIGYDRHDRSLSHKIYMVYAVAFYTLWVFVVLALFAGGVAQFLPLFGLGPVREAAVSLGVLGLLIWTLASAYSASQRSPLIFTEDDAYLICETPADRRAVTFAWLVGQWPGSAVLIWIVAVILGFAMIEGTAAGNLTGADIPRYLLSGLRSLSIMIPFQLGLLAWVWSLGVFRLQRDYYRPRLHLLPIALGALLVLGWILGRSDLLGGDFPLQVAQWPLVFPLQSAFGLSGWLPGMFAALIWLVSGLLCLAWVGKSLNLSRAAQESRQVAAFRSAMFSGDSQQLEELDKRRRLGTGRAPSPYLARGRWADHLRWTAIIRKDLAQDSRKRLFSRLTPWAGIFFMGLVVWFQTDWISASLILLYWTLLILQQGTRRLQDDLRMWPILRSLPLPAEQLLLAEVIVSGAGVLLATWASLLVALGVQISFSGLLVSLGLRSPLFPPVSAIFLAPSLVAVILLAGVFDVIRQSQSMNLIAGHAPAPAVVGVLIAGGITLLSLGLSRLSPPVFGWLLAFTLSTLSAYGLWRASARNYRRIK